MPAPDDLVRAIYDAPVEPAEFERRLRAALADEEDMRQLVELVAWFRRTYPTAGERLAYARRQVAASRRPRTRRA